MRGNNYSTVGVNEQKDMVNSGVRDIVGRRGTSDPRCVLKYRNYDNSLSHASTKHQVTYCINTSGDFVASARRLRFLGPLRTRAGSTVHYAIQELV
jgi:hypothetical protein